MIMGATYLASSTVSTNLFGRILFLFALTGLVASLGFADDVTGVVLSDHSGPSGHASGTLELAVVGKVQTLYYGEPLVRRFRAAVCRDIGAVWTVSLRATADSTLVIARASCHGRVDEDVHSSWLLVRDYLEAMMKSQPAAVDSVSARWRSSPEYRVYATKTSDLDLSGYQRFGRDGRCIDVGHKRDKDRIELTAGPDCSVDISGKAVNLFFTLHRNLDKGKWEIDKIEIR